MIAFLFLFVLLTCVTFWTILPKTKKNIRVDKDMADKELVATINTIVDGKSNWELVGSCSLGSGSNDRVVFDYERQKGASQTLKVVARADGEIIVRSSNFDGEMSVFDESLVSKIYSKYDDLVMNERIEKIHTL